jgi:chorismate mutase
MDRPQERPRPGLATPGELPELRREIEELDRRLVDLIAARCHLARAAGERKRAARLPVADPAQEALVVRRAAVRAREADVDEEAVRHLFWCVIGLSRKVQEIRTREERG